MVLHRLSIDAIDSTSIRFHLSTMVFRTEADEVEDAMADAVEVDTMAAKGCSGGRCGNSGNYVNGVNISDHNCSFSPKQWNCLGHEGCDCVINEHNRSAGHGGLNDNCNVSAASSGDNCEGNSNNNKNQRMMGIIQTVAVTVGVDSDMVPMETKRTPHPPDC